MDARMQLGNYLVAYLRRIGLTHLFGIPGDLVIQLFMKFGQPHDIRVITSSHEPGARLCCRWIRAGHRKNRRPVRDLRSRGT